jgi:GTPase
MGRPVAIITIGPDGVRVKPVVDVTKVALAGLAVWASMLGLLRARRQARNR